MMDMTIVVAVVMLNRVFYPMAITRRSPSPPLQPPMIQTPPAATRQHTSPTLLLVDLVHELISVNRDFCRLALHSIDRRMVAQIWNWVKEGIIELDQLDLFHAVQCMKEGAQAKAIRSALGTSICSTSGVDCTATLVQLAGVIESTMNLSVKFELDNTMKFLQSLKFVTDPCTVISLLLQQQEKQPNSSETLASSPLEPISTMVDDLSPARYLEYQLTRYWKFFLAIIQTHKIDVAMQRLVIWYGVRTLRDSKITCFLASKLGQRAHLDCLSENEQE